MNHSSPLTARLVRTIPIFLSILLFSACAQYSKMKLHDDLRTNVHQFNKRFEGKMMDLSAVYVKSSKRKEFLIDSVFIKNKVTFYDSSVLEIQFFDEDKPVKKTANGVEKEFNRAIVSMRYQIAVLPSNQLKTIMLDQIWVLDQEQWRVEPDLDILLK